MITVVDNKDKIRDHLNSNRPFVIYGAGTIGQQVACFFEHVDYFCDKRASELNMVHNIPVITLETLADLKKECTILICVKNDRKVFQDICSTLDEAGIDANVFDYYQNESFEHFEYLADNRENNKEPLKVHIVYGQDGWILNKFGNKLSEELEQLGVIVSSSDYFDAKADVNHVIPYRRLVDVPTTECFKQSVITTMVTHIDCQAKVNHIKFLGKNDVMNICMSSETVDTLAKYGVPRETLCYVNPAQDGVMKPKKIVLGITHKNHSEIDHRKKIDVLLQICEQIDPTYFSFKIMGAGWDKIVSQMKDMGFEVEYYDDFHYETYLSLMPSLDYYIFFGFDEGSMGYLDALAAGVKTIVTPQGFHLDLPDGITNPCKTITDIINILQDAKMEKEKIVRLVKDWTWENYAKKHLEIWNYLTKRKSLSDLFTQKHQYQDGIFSVLIDTIE